MSTVNTSSPRYPGNAFAAPLMPAKNSSYAASCPGLTRRVTVAVTGPAAPAGRSGSRLTGHHRGIRRRRPAQRSSFLRTGHTVG